MLGPFLLFSNLFPLSFAIILQGKGDLVGLIVLLFGSSLGLKFVILVFPDHTRLHLWQLKNNTMV